MDGDAGREDGGLAEHRVRVARRVDGARVRRVHGLMAECASLSLTETGRKCASMAGFVMFANAWLSVSPAGTSA